MQKNSKGKIKVARVGVREDGAELKLTTFADGHQHLDFILGDKALKAARQTGVRRDDLEVPYMLAEYDPDTRVLTTYPRVTRTDSINLFEPKYSFSSISFEDQDAMEPPGEGFAMLFEFPTGFHNDPFEGMGVVRPLRFIFEAFSEVDGITDVMICDDDRISRVGDTIRLPEAHYDEVRLAINRAHDTAVSFANEDKRAYLKGQLLPGLVQEEKLKGRFRRSAADLKQVVEDAMLSPGKPRVKNPDATAAVSAVRQSAKALVEENPTEIYELNREIELITLESLIAKFGVMLERNGLQERHWHSFLKENPFILRLAFGLPVMVMGDQVSVGGTKFDGSGGKLADFLVKAGLLGNLALIEIKKPGTALLDPKPYRGDIHPPSRELAGGVNQVLDQRFRLQQEINNRKASSRQHDVFAYAVQCLVIAGRAPKDETHRKSFEFYRTSMRDVMIVTFDELHEKLRSLYAFLNQAPEEPELKEDDDDDFSDII